MPHLRGKNKGKSGRVDLIEDILGTEALKGTYKDRAKLTKMNAREAKLIRERENKRLKEILAAKEKMLRQNLFNSEKVKHVNEIISFILPYTLDPDAYVEMNRLSIVEPSVCKTIIKYLFPPQEFLQIEKYAETITSKGHGPKTKVTLKTIKRIYVKIKENVDKIGRKVA